MTPPAVLTPTALRAGLATAAGDAGAALPDLMQQTRRKSTQAALAYLRHAHRRVGHRAAGVAARVARNARRDRAGVVPAPFRRPGDRARHLVAGLAKDGLLLIIEGEARSGPLNPAYLALMQEFRTLERSYTRAQLERMLALGVWSRGVVTLL